MVEHQPSRQQLLQSGSASFNSKGQSRKGLAAGFSFGGLQMAI